MPVPQHGTHCSRYCLKLAQPEKVPSCNKPEKIAHFVVVVVVVVVVVGLVVVIYLHEKAT